MGTANSINNKTIDTFQSNNISSLTSNTDLTLSGVGTGIVNILDGIKLPTTGGTQSQFDYYEDGTHNTTWSGIWISPVTGNISFIRIGKIVSLYFPDIVAVANISSNFQATTNLPTRLRPTSFISFPVRVKDNGNLQTTVGLMDINSTGNIFVYLNLAGANFTGAGDSGLTICTVTYRIA